MGYSISITGSDLSLNITYNVSPIYYKAIDGGLMSLSYKTVIEAMPILKEAIFSILVYREDYEKLNPPNGWGDCASALQILIDLAKECDLQRDALNYHGRIIIS